METGKQHIDWYILIPVVGLMLFSIAFVYSASASIAELRFGYQEKLFWSHSIKVLIAIVLVIVFAKIDYHFWQKISMPLMILSLLMLIIVLFGGSSVKGSYRWISLGPVTFQPSEFVKFALVIHFSSLLTAKQQHIKDFEKGFLPFLLWIGIICILIALQPNFSTMFVIFMIGFLMMFIGNTNIMYLGITGISGLIMAMLYGISADYRLNRIMSFLGMSDGAKEQTYNYQLTQSLLALGNGGIFGMGPGQNRQSHLFLPESYGDFIFAIIGEDYGFVGVFIILAAFVLIFWRGMLIAKKAPDNFGYFLAVGILFTFAIYVLVNAGVNTGLLPTTGVPMPFISYGGTALFIYAAAIGILLNISSKAGVYEK